MSIDSTTLDKLIGTAARDPRARVALVRALCDTTLYAYGPHDGGEGTLRLMTREQHGGSSSVPIFTSRQRAEEGAAVAIAWEMLRVVEGRGRVLLEAARGTAVVIDPDSDHACALSADELESALAGLE